MNDIPIIHAIADARVLSDPDFTHKAVGVLAALGPHGAVHLRAREMARRVYDLTTELVGLQGTSSCRIVVNERIDIARAAGAWGIQLPARSFLVADARRLAPGTRLGVSVHDASEASAAADEGADWLLAGSVFVTESHPTATPQGVEWIRNIARLGVPVVAIGGVRATHVTDLRAHGAHGVAAIRGIWDSADPAKAARQYLESALARS